MTHTETPARHTALMRETHHDHWNDASNNVFVDGRPCDAIFSTRCGVYETHPTVTLALARAEKFLASGDAA